TVLLLKNLDGQIYANQKGWRMNFDLLKLLRWFSSEQLGNPTRDLQTQMDKLRDFIHDGIDANFNPPLDGLIVFSNPKVNVEISNVELPVVMLNQNPDALKDALRKPKNVSPVSKQDYDQLYALFEEEAAARRVEAERGLVIAGRKIL
ncbi:MAG: hypothetical protein L0Y55_19010, partial [Anaerolineales bacterium]|nr:hypothetical protein [Anaerolineales bacterium]